MVSKKKIAILTGGPGSEREISFKSADLVYRALQGAGYDVSKIDIREDAWYLMGTETAVDLNDFSVMRKGHKIVFDVAYPVLHGSPAEDGKLQGYLEMKRIPFVGCSAELSAITFDKFFTKELLHNRGLRMPFGKLITKRDEKSVVSIEDFWDQSKENKLSRRVEPFDFFNDDSSTEVYGSGTRNFPLFVKPNKNGSSFGVSKVHNEEELKIAIEKGFEFDDELLVEEHIDGVECSCGVYRDKNGKIVALPLTEIVPEDDFFTYDAKYKNKSKEITPPVSMSEAKHSECQGLSRDIYDYLNCDSIVRIDYILKGFEFYFLEINTIPGLSPESIVPQQIRTADLEVNQFFVDQLEMILKN